MKNDGLRIHVNMAEYASMKTGGTAEECYFPETEEGLCDVVRRLASAKRRFAVLGNLTNVLLSDGILSFTPVVTSGIRTNGVTEKTADGLILYASCGVSLTRLAYETAKAGQTGLEFAYGIPGSLGGAVFMNAGAYGSEMKNVVRAVRYYNAAQDCVETVPAETCAFGYRSSAFQTKGGVILGAELALSYDSPEGCLARAKDFMQRRTSKQPLEYPSCGSAFKRPEGYFAGELIEKCGLKGFAVGGACVSEKHAGFIVNKGGATTKDVVELMQLVVSRVREQFGVTLEPEIQRMD